MSNQEPVYQHRGGIRQAFDSTQLNDAIREAHILDLSAESTHGSHTMSIIRLRHFLLSELDKNPQSPAELARLNAKVKSRIDESIWDQGSRDRIMQICTTHWVQKLLPGMLESSVKSIKFKLLNSVPVMTLADIGFAFSDHAKKGTASEDFMFDTVLPLLGQAKLGKSARGRAYAVIKQEYDHLMNLMA